MIQWTYRRRFKSEQIEPGTKLKGMGGVEGGGGQERTAAMAAEAAMAARRSD